MDSTVFPNTSGVYGIEATVAFWRKRSFSGEKRDFPAEETRFFLEKGGNPATKNAFLVHGCTKRPVDRDSSGIRGQTALPWPCLGPQQTIPLVEMPFEDVPKHSHLANCLGLRPREFPTDRMDFRARKTSLFPRLFARAGAKKGLARGQKSARNGQKTQLLLQFRKHRSGNFQENRVFCPHLAEWRDPCVIA